jgi:very-short-patch-repair endonuclease
VSAISQPDLAIARLAARQNGNVTRQQLLQLGLSARQIVHRLRTGRLFRVYPGVYSVGRPPATPVEKASAAVLACGPGAALSHRSAATLWGFLNYWDAPLHVTVAVDRRPRRIRTHRSILLPRWGITTHLGVRVTKPAWTLLACATELPDRLLTRAVNEALASPFLTREQLSRTVVRFRTHPGASRVAPFVSVGDGPTRSEFEDAFLAFCERFGFPRPRVNVRIAGHLVDALFPQQRLIVELDGWRYHSTQKSFEGDRDRDADTLLAGFATVRITWARMTATPGREAVRLKRILASRESRPQRR